MDEDLDPEHQRLRKLVEDSIIQLEKEKMTILQGSGDFHEDISAGNLKTCSNVRISSPIKTCSRGKTSPAIKACSHSKTSSPTKQTRADIDPKNVHSHICFLKNMESLLTINNKRSLLNDSKNRYIPCAIPLSPPIRLKRDEDVNVHISPPVRLKRDEDVNMHISPPIRLKRDEDVKMHTSSRIQNDCSDQTFPKKISEEFLIPSQPNSSTILKHTCGKSFSDYTYKQSSPVHTCEKSSSYIIDEKRFSSVPVFCPERNAKEMTEQHKLQASDQKSLLVVSNKNSATFKNSNSSFVSDKNMNDSSQEKEIPERKVDGRKEEKFIRIPVSKHSESILKGEDEKNGFHFQVSLDSTSTKDVINTMLQKIPEIINKFGTSSHETVDISSSHKEQTQIREQVFYPKKFNVPGPSKMSNESASNCTQTVPDEQSYSNIQRSIKVSDIQMKINSASTQTGINSEELLPKKSELQLLIKDIVLQTLQEMQICEHIAHAKFISPIQKVDSGIQSEVESEMIKSGPFQDQQSCESPKKSIVLSKGVQTETDTALTTSAKKVQSKKSFTEYPEFSFDELKEVSPAAVSRKESTGCKFAERSSTPVNNPSDKIEIMLEKIYEHVCQEKETSGNVKDISFQNPFSTRDVAVQFNPLHTSTKSTLTLEIKHKDSACQSDIPSKTDSDQNSLVNASVQVDVLTEPSEDNHELINASTQCKQKVYLNTFTQTETLMNLEHSATNTSASTTPVSDSIFMDDLISEGEIPLPWNLRLLSDSGGSISVNNPDSSDTSAREKDYSLSEGEVPPHKILYWSLGTNLESEDAKKPDGSYFCGRNLQLQSFNSSLSEGEYNSNTSLSLGEVSPDLRASFLYPSNKTEDDPSFKSSSRRDEFYCDNLASNVCSQRRNVFGCSKNSDISVQEHENENICRRVDLKNLSQDALPTVEEEIHSSDDQ